MKEKIKEIKQKKISKKYFFIVIIFFIVGYMSFLHFNNENVTEKTTVFVKDDGKKEKKVPLKIGYVTDVQCYSKLDKETGKWEANWRCKYPIDAFSKQMNESFKPNFVMEGGDLTDGRDKRPFESFLTAKTLYEQVDAPKYHVLGNHEVNNFSREKWLETVGYKKAYYSFDVNDYRIIVLDGNYRPLVGGGSVAVEPEENKYYPGLIDQKQIKWLEKLLETSDDFIKIVFVHQPPIDDVIGKNENELMFNAEELRALFSKYKVKAVFAGHIEEFCALEADDVEYYVLQGFYKGNKRLEKSQRYKDAGVFSEIVVDDNKVDVKVYYMQEKEGAFTSMSLNQETVACNNTSVVIKSANE